MEKLKAKLKALFGTYGRVNAALIAAVLALTVIVNIAVLALTQAFSLYLYASPKYSHRIGQGTADFLEGVAKEEDRVKILFCMQPQELEGDTIYNLVYQTALQMEAAFSFISVETVNIFTEPERVEPYKYKTEENERTRV